MKHSTFKHFENGYCQSLFSSHYYNGHLFFILWKLFGESCMCRESTSPFIKIEIHSSHFMDVDVTRVFINTDSKLAMRHKEWLEVFGLRNWVNNGDIFKHGEDWEFLGIKTKDSVYDILGLKCLLCYLFLNIYLFGCVGSWLQHMGSSLQYMDSLAVMDGLSCSACGILVPHPGTEPHFMYCKANS